MIGREKWSSKLGFLAAAIGSAVGIGNIWRFPYILGINGGSFLIPYLIAVFVFGVPVMLIELATGRKLRGSIITSFRRIHPNLKWLGFIPVLVLFFITSYYLVVTGWVLAYFTFFLSGEAITFGNFVNTILPLIFAGLSLFFVAFVVKSGIVKGIESLTKIMMPVFFLLLTFLLIRMLMLPKAIEGVTHYFKPDLSKILNINVWLLAFGQAMFSLSAGYGIMMTFGSYLRKDEDIPQVTLITAFFDTLVAVMAGFLIFSAIYSFNLQLDEGPNLAFIVLPNVFKEVFLGEIFGAIFYLLLVFAAISSAISMLELIVANLIDEFSFTRSKAVVVVSSLLFLVMVPIALNFSVFGRNLLEGMDHLFGSLLTLVSAALICIVIGWFWNPKTLLDEINIEIMFGKRKSILYKISRFLDYLVERDILITLVRYVIPGILILMLLLRVLGSGF
jgi:NSS family neurotransmitter:Na+ symporter